MQQHVQELQSHNAAAFFRQAAVSDIPMTTTNGYALETNPEELHRRARNLSNTPSFLKQGGLTNDSLVPVPAIGDHSEIQTRVEEEVVPSCCDPTVIEQGQHDTSECCKQDRENGKPTPDCPRTRLRRFEKSTLLWDNRQPSRGVRDIQLQHRDHLRNSSRPPARTAPPGTTAVDQHKALQEFQTRTLLADRPSDWEPPKTGPLQRREQTVFLSDKADRVIHELADPPVKQRCTNALLPPRPDQIPQLDSGYPIDFNPDIVRHKPKLSNKGEFLKHPDYAIMHRAKVDLPCYAPPALDRTLYSGTLQVPIIQQSIGGPTIEASGLVQTSLGTQRQGISIEERQGKVVQDGNRDLTIVPDSSHTARILTGTLHADTERQLRPASYFNRMSQGCDMDVKMRLPPLSTQINNRGDLQQRQVDYAPSQHNNLGDQTGHPPRQPVLHVENRLQQNDVQYIDSSNVLPDHCGKTIAGQPLAAEVLQFHPPTYSTAGDVRDFQQWAEKQSHVLRQLHSLEDTRLVHAAVPANQFSVDIDQRGRSWKTMGIGLQQKQDRPYDEQLSNLKTTVLDGQGVAKAGWTRNKEEQSMQLTSPVYHPSSNLDVGQDWKHGSLSGSVLQQALIDRDQRPFIDATDQPAVIEDGGTRVVTGQLREVTVLEDHLREHAHAAKNATLSDLTSRSSHLQERDPVVEGFHVTGPDCKGADMDVQYPQRGAKFNRVMLGAPRPTTDRPKMQFDDPHSKPTPGGAAHFRQKRDPVTGQVKGHAVRRQVPLSPLPKLGLDVPMLPVETRQTQRRVNTSRPQTPRQTPLPKEANLAQIQRIRESNPLLPDPF